MRAVDTSRTSAIHMCQWLASRIGRGCNSYNWLICEDSKYDQIVAHIVSILSKRRMSLWTESGFCKLSVSPTRFILLEQNRAHFCSSQIFLNYTGSNVDSSQKRHRIYLILFVHIYLQKLVTRVSGQTPLNANHQSL